MSSTKKAGLKSKLKKIIRKTLRKTIPLSMALVITFNTTAGIALAQYYFYKNQTRELIAYKESLEKDLAATPERQAERLKDELFPEEGVKLPVKWNDIGQRLVEIGVIDKEKFLSLFKQGPISGQNSEYDKILSGVYDDYIVLTEANSHFVLNALWALGLAQKSVVLEDMQSQYDQVHNLAATGGWTIAKSNAMDYYGKHNMVELNSDQNNLVKKIASNIYRPCCDNHTAFSDCNHGMAMLGLIELMVADGFSEEEIYETALQVNTYWFSDTYMTIARYMEEKEGKEWKDVDPKIILGANFSSGSGYRNVYSQVKPLPSAGSGGGCGV